MTNYDRRGPQPNPKKPGPDKPRPTPTSTPATNPYLNDRQNERVGALLGDKYDPTKPLNQQLFKARWEQASQEERRTMAKNLSGNFVEGVNFKSLSGFHTQYLDALKEENRMLQQTMDEQLTTYSQEGGGYATTQDDMNQSLAYWTSFAATPEGQAHIAQTGMSPEDWLAKQQADLQTGVDNYTAQQKQFSQIQNLAARIGTDVPGFKPPGWDSTLASIQAGTGPLPGARTMSMYPGVAADIAGIDPGLYQLQSHSKKTEADVPGASQTNTGGLYQPFTGMTGVQQPNSFSERDLYQESQSR